MIQTVFGVLIEKNLKLRKKKKNKNWFLIAFVDNVMNNSQSIFLAARDMLLMFCIFQRAV